ncbi:piggyBac transposable element-derived protein 4-like [Heptranchias perlo]|uniref:piggyBac transposable element-derived protein 4-like n=1 Tax=Heptranchias perlo TaxID=212740 RepID=UPI003559A05F
MSDSDSSDEGQCFGFSYKAAVGSDISADAVSESEEEKQEEESGESPHPLRSPRHLQTSEWPWSPVLQLHEEKKFTEKNGALYQLGPELKEIDFFSLFFHPELFELLSTETNKYAHQQISGRADTKWYPTTAEEIKAFLGIHIYMSIVSLPSYKMYWSNDSLFGSFPIKDLMTRDRFEKMLQYYHINDNTTNPTRGHLGHDKLHNVRPVLDAVLEACRTVYFPHRENSIGEATTGFRGNICQNMEEQPCKRHIKIYTRADAHNGFVCEFQIYTGREQDTPELGLRDRIVKSLAAVLKKKNYLIYCDNFFTTQQLFQELYLDGIYACGAVRNNLSWPQELTNRFVAKQPQGYIKQLQCGILTATAWKDNKPLLLLSTYPNPTGTCTIFKKLRDSSILELKCPVVVADYNTH